MIVVHVGPDGDAMGSSLGLWHYLMTIEKEPTIIVPGFSILLSWMPGAENVLVYETNQHKCEEIIENTDLIFLDFNVPSRLAKRELLWLLKHQ